ncbi:MAG TPA: nuclear transport factor 2 family protein [Thermoleophilaceae bacterium]
MTPSNADTVRQGFEAVTHGDLGAITELLDPDVKWHGGDPASGCQNKDEALHLIEQALANGRVGELVDVIEAAGGQVVVVMRPPGQTDLRANLSTFRDGKVVEMVAYESPEDALAAAS